MPRSRADSTAASQVSRDLAPAPSCRAPVGPESSLTPGELLLLPALDVFQPVADVSTDSNADGAVALGSPLVDGGSRHLEPSGDLLRGQVVTTLGLHGVLSDVENHYGVIRWKRE